MTSEVKTCDDAADAGHVFKDSPWRHEDEATVHAPAAAAAAKVAEGRSTPQEAKEAKEERVPEASGKAKALEARDWQSEQVTEARDWRSEQVAEARDWRSEQVAEARDWRSEQVTEARDWRSEQVAEARDWRSEQVPVVSGLVIDFLLPDSTKETKKFVRRPLGIDFYKTRPISMKRVQAGSHGKELGIQPGWQVVAVNGEDVAAKEFDYTYRLLRNLAAQLPQQPAEYLAA
eukprot:CAMPEP_0115761474 /NCGR_PEP_ID=MMETSP0272-20121206/100523_1 /TAXON_ID=71861 /ORGANISM="Scrippsiella trochoidea, Strain CCMP3099" /LENGTH=231 /DNA_ID=CAMNT_0003207151 /DNA_START=15 /DNA_END=706 /DNA_ORIENTATION=-